MEIKVANKTIKATDNVQAAATSQAVYIFAMPPNSYVLSMFARVKTAFTGVTGPSVEVGLTGQTTRYIPKQEINAVKDLISGWGVNGMGYCQKQAPDQQIGTTAQRNIIATFRSTSGNLSSLSAGEIEFVVIYAE